MGLLDVCFALMQRKSKRYTFELCGFIFARLLLCLPVDLKKKVILGSTCISPFLSLSVFIPFSLKKNKQHIFITLRDQNVRNLVASQE